VIAPEAALWPPAPLPAYRPPGDAVYWDRTRETMSADERAALILGRIQSLMRWAWEKAPFYRTRWQAAGLEPGDITSLEAFARVPTIEKADLRADQAAHPPFGSYLCIEPHEIVRVHGTSGTSGRPTAFAWSRDDFDRIAEAHARIMWSFGLRPALRRLVGDARRGRASRRDVVSVRRRRPGDDAASPLVAARDAPGRLLRHAVIRAAHR
jgi:phenylacetate-CoA ligase